MTFAERLIQLRKQHGLTQQALADRAEIHVTLLRRYEAGKTQPNIDTLRRIALALTISADLLLFDENERGPADELRAQFEATQQLSDDENKPSNASSKDSSSPTKPNAGPPKHQPPNKRHTIAAPSPQLVQESFQSSGIRRWRLLHWS